MKIEVGKFYKLKNGKIAEIKSDNNDFYFGITTQASSDLWDKPTGENYNDKAHDIDQEIPGLYSVWMVQARNADPVPVPNEEIARAWAVKNGGRAFRVVEVIE